MRIIKKIALFFMLVLIFALPTNVPESDLFIADISLVKIAGLLTFGLTLVLILAGQRLRADAAFHTAALLNISWIMLSFIWSMMPVDYDISQSVNSQQLLKENFYILITMLLLFQIANDSTDLKFFALAFLLGGFWLIYLVLRDYHTTVSTIRYTITGFDPNEVGVELAMILPIATYLIISSKSWWWRIPALLYFPPAIFSILIGGSRTGAVVMIVGLSGLWILVRRLGIGGKAISIAILILILIGIAGTLPQKTVERILSTGQEVSSGTLSDRGIVWSYAYEEWVKSPIYGHGLSSFQRIVNSHNINYTAHNSFVSMVVEQGIIGILLYLCVISTAVLCAFRLPNEDRVPMLSMLAVVVIGQMSLTLNNRIYIWFAYAFPVLMLYLKNNSTHQNHK